MASSNQCGRTNRPYSIVYYDRPPLNYYPLSPRCPYSVGAALKDTHRQFRFDIIHAHWVYVQGYVAVRFARKHNIPVVITCHGGDVDPKARYLQKWFSRNRIIWTLRHANAVTAVSESLAQQVGMLTDGKTETQVIHNGVEVVKNDSSKVTIPANLEYLKNQPFILTLGRLHPAKGLDLLLFNAVKLLRTQHKSVPTLIVAGDGRPANKNRLWQYVRAHDLSSCIKFVGSVSGPTKTWLLSNCEFLVQPSRSEGLAISVLEAMSHGKGVLAVCVGGLPELVRNQENGLLIKPNSVRALAQGLERMLSADLSAFGAKARKVAREHPWNVIGKSYLDIYEAVSTTPITQI